MYPEDFKKQEFDKFVYEMRYTFQDKTTKGIFAPWAIYKEDITSIGMHDESFHSYHEDSDMFNRFILNGYEIVQTWAALVYHLTCRGGQFQDGIEKITTDPVFHRMKQNAFRNYIRKWGHFVKNNEYQYPIIPHKYNIGITLINPTYEIFNFMEPWASNINVNLPSHQLDMYVELEQPNTTINLKDKINNDSVTNDIEVKIDANKMTNESVNFIVDLSAILDDNNLEVGEYQFDIFNIKVNKIRHYENELIKNNN